VKLIDAPRCPYCARARLGLAEKGLAYETVEIDLDDRPAWLFELDAAGRVPVLEDGFVLPESDVIMAYLEESYADLAYAPWVIRARDLLGVTLPDRLEAWFEALPARPSVAAEVEVVRSL
jgi:glutathione S-transferase